MNSCVIQSARLNCIFARSTGKYDVDDHSEIFKIVTSLDLYREGAPVLFEMQRVDFGEPPRDFGSAPHDQGARTRDDTSIQKVAQVVTSDDGATTLQEFGRRTQRSGPIKEIFRSLEDALDWLAVPNLHHRVPPNIDQEIDRMLESNSEKGGQPKVILGKERDRPT